MLEDAYRGKQVLQLRNSLVEKWLCFQGTAGASSLLSLFYGCSNSLIIETQTWPV